MKFTCTLLGSAKVTNLMTSETARVKMERKNCKKINHAFFHIQFVA